MTWAGLGAACDTMRPRSPYTQARDTPATGVGGGVLGKGHGQSKTDGLLSTASFLFIYILCDHTYRSLRD